MTYQSICGCLTSAPEPSPCEMAAGDWPEAHDQWQQEWQQAVAEHHTYCCEAAHRDLRIPTDRCLVGRDAECPHMRRE